MLQANCLGILLLVSGSLALYSSSDDVVELSASNFRSKTKDGVWVVEFFAPWCGHCQNLVPEYKKAATALKGVIPVGAVDADEHKSLAKEFQVTGFPTIKIFKNGVPVHYDGARSAQGIVDSALKHAKDLAYLRMGRKGDSSDKYLRLGHVIPWKKINNSPLMSLAPLDYAPPDNGIDPNPDMEKTDDFLSEYKTSVSNPYQVVSPYYVDYTQNQKDLDAILKLQGDLFRVNEDGQVVSPSLIRPRKTRGKSTFYFLD